MAQSEFTKLKKRLYENYKANMKMYGKEGEISPYNKWVKEVNNVKLKKS